MFSLPPVPPPPEHDDLLFRDVLVEVLLTLIDSGSAYVREHPEVKVKLSRVIGDKVIHIDIERQAAGGEP